MSGETAPCLPAARPAAGRPGWPLLAALLLIAAHLLLFDRGLGGDGWASFALLSSAVEDGDLVIENDTHGVMNGLVARPDGRLASQYPPGGALLDLGPFLLGAAADRLLPAAWLTAGVDVPPVGRVHRRLFLEVAAIVAARNLAVLLGAGAIAFALGRLGFAPRPAAGATALVFFAGPLLFYGLVGMTHAPTFALASLLLLLLAGDDGSRRRAALAGVVVGMAVLVRYSAVALVVPLVAGVGGRGRWRRAGLAIAACALPLLLLPPFWRLQYGQWLPLGYGGVLAATLASPWNVLLSPHHGLLVFHPALALGLVGLLIPRAPVAPARRDIRRLALAWFLAVAVLHGCWSEWANAGGWGQRFMIDALPALAPGFAALLAARRGRRCLAAALALLVALGYALFLGAVTGLARAADGSPWPQTLADYAPLIEHPPGAAELGQGLGKASFLLRSLAGHGGGEAGPATPAPDAR